MKRRRPQPKSKPGKPPTISEIGKTGKEGRAEEFLRSLLFADPAAADQLLLSVSHETGTQGEPGHYAILTWTNRAEELQDVLRDLTKIKPNSVTTYWGKQLSHPILPLSADLEPVEHPEKDKVYLCRIRVPEALLHSLMPCEIPPPER